MNYLRIGNATLLALLAASFSAAFTACGGSDESLFPAAAAVTGTATGTATGAGTGGATGAGGGSATGAGGAATGAGGAATVEDCQDGIDNNGDGLVDCADSACQPDFECLDEAPASWRGPVWVERGTYPAAEPECRGSLDHLFAGPAGPAQCSPCNCDWPGASCSPPEISCYYGSTDCSGSVDYMATPMGPGCIGDPPVPGTFSSASCRLTKTGAVLNPGTCTPTGGDLAPASPFAEDVFVCAGATAAGGCAAGQVCVPKTAGKAICIVAPGAQSCPSGWTTAQVQAYGSGDDTRSCAACQCDPAGVTCGGKFVVYDQDNCGGGTADVTSMSCVNVSSLLDGNTGSLLPDGIDPVPGACLGGQAMGSVTLQDEQTICCQ